MLADTLANNYRLILASQSPRRKMLLAGLDIDFEIIVRDGIEEDFPAELGMIQIPEFLAESKSSHYTDLLDDRTIVITADTIVWHKERVVGKPVDAKNAKEILQELSGDKHIVVTGVCLRSSNKMKVFSAISEVHFHKLKAEEIDYYIENYKPMDKAGAYGIQEWIGYIGIEKIEGSFYNVMGLPVQQLYSELQKFIEV